MWVYGAFASILHRGTQIIFEIGGGLVQRLSNGEWIFFEVWNLLSHSSCLWIDVLVQVLSVLVVVHLACCCLAVVTSLRWWYICCFRSGYWSVYVLKTSLSLGWFSGTNLGTCTWRKECASYVQGIICLVLHHSLQCKMLWITVQ